MDWIFPSMVISTAESSITCFAWAMTSLILSPGKIRKLIRAWAVVGNTLALTPPWMMVGAVVVRIMALVVFPVPNTFKSRGLNAH